MAVPARRKINNHIRSLYKFIEANFRSVHSVTCTYGNMTFDVSDDDQWLDITFLSFGAGRKGETLVQFDLYSRIRGPSSGGDEYGETLIDLGDKLHAAMHVDAIQIYDYATPSSPVLLANQKLIVLNSGGTFREPEEDRFFDVVDGVARRSLTYRLIMVEDASGADSYYD
jgi:hypothetical protein